MRVEILSESVANALGSFVRGDVVDGRERDLRPLVDSGMAREVMDEPAPRPKKKGA